MMGQQNVWIQCGLRMWTVSKDHIEVAKSISSEALNLFLESGHPALRNREVLTQILPVSSWQFFATDKVRILAKAWPELLPWCPESTDTNWVGEGVVQEVNILSCMVLVNSKLQSIPKNPTAIADGCGDDGGVASWGRRNHSADEEIWCCRAF